MPLRFIQATSLKAYLKRGMLTMKSMTRLLLATACLSITAHQCALAKSPVAKSNDLAGSTFVCPGSFGMIYTFFPDNKFNMVVNNSVITSRVTPISYKYDGKVLSIVYINVNGIKRTQNFDVTYLEKKGKLILKDEKGDQEICNER
jgi:hypothetical protein